MYTITKESFTALSQTINDCKFKIDGVIGDLKAVENSVSKFSNFHPVAPLGTDNIRTDLEGINENKSVGNFPGKINDLLKGMLLKAPEISKAKSLGESVTFVSTIDASNALLISSEVAEQDISSLSNKLLHAVRLAAMALESKATSAEVEEFKNALGKEIQENGKKYLTKTSKEAIESIFKLIKKSGIDVTAEQAYQLAICREQKILARALVDNKVIHTDFLGNVTFNDKSFKDIFSVSLEQIISLTKNESYYVSGSPIHIFSNLKKFLIKQRPEVPETPLPKKTSEKYIETPSTSHFKNVPLNSNPCATPSVIIHNNLNGHSLDNSYGSLRKDATLIARNGVNDLNLAEQLNQIKEENHFLKEIITRLESIIDDSKSNMKIFLKALERRDSNLDDLNNKLAAKRGLINSLKDKIDVLSDVNDTLHALQDNLLRRTQDFERVKAELTIKEAEIESLAGINKLILKGINQQKVEENGSDSAAQNAPSNTIDNGKVTSSTKPVRLTNGVGQGGGPNVASTHNK